LKFFLGGINKIYDILIKNTYLLLKIVMYYTPPPDPPFIIIIIIIIIIYLYLSIYLSIFDNKVWYKPLFVVKWCID
jgi:hypothetical protein